MNEPQLFTVLFRRHAREVHRFIARRTRNSTVADDITAVTFEKCWKALPTYQPMTSTMRPWLLRIAANEVASHFRSENRRRAREQLTAASEGPPDSLANPPHDDHRELLDALGQLGERHQLVLSLRFLTDLSTEETAAAVGVSKNHCAVLQHRALTALRRVIEGRPT